MTDSTSTSFFREKRNLLYQHPWLILPGLLMWVFFGFSFLANSVAEKNPAARMFGTDAGSVSSLCFGIGILLCVVAIGSGGLLALRRSLKDAQRLRDIRERGIAVNARVVGLKETGGHVSHNPWVALELEIERDEPYRITTEALISTLAIPRIQPGCVIDVWIDPDDPQQVAIDESLSPS